MCWFFSFAVVFPRCAYTLLQIGNKWSSEGKHMYYNIIYIYTTTVAIIRHTQSHTELRWHKFSGGRFRPVPPGKTREVRYVQLYTISFIYNMCTVHRDDDNNNVKSRINYFYFISILFIYIYYTQ